MRPPPAGVGGQKHGRSPSLVHDVSRRDDLCEKEQTSRLRNVHGTM